MMIRLGRVMVPLLTAGSLVAACLTLGAAPAAAQSPPAGTGCGAPVAAAPTSPAVISAMSSPYGQVLVVGAGDHAGCSVYFLTADELAAFGASYACTALCDTNIWPAVLTDGAPMAGPGVNPTLLGSVTRMDILGSPVQQVTYAGHPLYRFIFDVKPGDTKGANLFDPLTAPAGVWYLLQPARGLPAPGTATVGPESVALGSTGTTETVAGASLTGLGGTTLFPTYTFTADGPPSVACVLATSPRPGCSVFWPPVLTVGRPQAIGGLNPQDLGIIVRPDGSQQVTFMGRPLYLFVRDAGAPGVANGNGIHAFGGIFDLAALH